ncbi:MAG: hypothetical protein P1V19_23220 [Gimesia sp.]|nr:hypothetical protein [Gimesia sp.]
MQSTKQIVSGYRQPITERDLIQSPTKIATYTSTTGIKLYRAVSHHFFECGHHGVAPEFIVFTLASRADRSELLPPNEQSQTLSNYPLPEQETADCFTRLPWRNVLLTESPLLTRDIGSFGRSGKGTLSECDVPERPPGLGIESDSLTEATVGS